MRAIFLIMIGLSTTVFADFTRDNTNGIVTDSQTLLQWQDVYISNGGNIKSINWRGALNYCKALSLYDTGSAPSPDEKWRLPNIRELFSIVDHNADHSSISSVFRTVHENGYWSSTSDTRSPDKAMLIYFQFGDLYSNNKSQVYSVRCVR